MKMINVLINVYGCRPDSGSETGMGWNWIAHLSVHCRLLVLTEGQWRDEIEAAVAQLSHRENLHFYYLPVSDKVREMCWNQGNWLFYLHYRRWQLQAYRKALEIIASQRIDLVHQLNFIGYREPGYLWRIKHIPYVWGPVGGMENMPLNYISGVGFSQKLFVLVKNILNVLQLKLQWRVRKAMNRADKIISSGAGVDAIIRREFGVEPVMINETGCFPAEADEQPKQLPSALDLTGQTDVPADSNFNLIWVGKFDYRKQLGLALRTIHEVRHLRGLKFHILGSGSKADVVSYQRLADELGLQDICIWHGNQPIRKVHALMQASQVMFFTSIMDATSTVIVEALSNKLPVICFNICGFGPLIDETTGCKVELTSPKQSVSDFKEKIEYLYYHKNELEIMSENCGIKSRGELAWTEKAKKMLQIYEELLH